ncbi:MAG: phage holin family protein [Clostridia bacterium]|nr:phage holin family protein [Clostridia bacterium]
MFFCGFFAVKNTEKADALLASNIPLATRIGNGDDEWNENDDLWDSTNNRFNGVAIKNLKATLFGDVDPVDFIKDANNYDAQEAEWGNGYIVPASTLSDKIEDEEKRPYGYVVKLGGLDWIVTSTTLADVDGKKDQAIVTLYLADQLMKTVNGTDSPVMSIFYSQKANVKGNNIYCRSLIRSNILSGANDFAKLAMFTDKTTAGAAFATKYLVQPKNITYQVRETAKDRGSVGVKGIPGVNLASEALDPTVGEWPNGISYTASETFDNIRYDDWGNDYIWIPSLTETGSSDVFTTTSIWKLSVQQVENAKTECSFLRTAFNNYAYHYLIEPAGTASYTEPHYARVVRPAIHLNLNTAAWSASMPENTTKTYNGEEQSLESEIWYNKSVFNNDKFCTVTYKNNKTGELVDAPKDAGTYTVTFTLKGSEYAWAGSTSKKHEMTLTIKPKALEVTFEKNKKGVPELSLIDEPFEGDTVECVIRYFDKAADDESRQNLGTNSSVLLGKVWYYAAAEFDNPNYEPDLSEVDREIYFQNPATPVNFTWKNGEGKKTYTGNILTFHMNFNNMKDKVQITCGEGVTYDNYDGFKATNVGKYYLTLHLINSDDYIWGSEMGEAAGTTEDATIEFEIIPKPLTFSYSPTANTNWDWSVTLGGSCNVPFDLPNVVSGSLDVVFFARISEDSMPYDIGGTTLTNEVQAQVSCKFITNNIDEADTYYLGIRAADPDSAAAKNYSFKFDKPYTLTIKDPASTSGLIWRLSADNRPAGSMQDPAASTSATWNKTITYDGKAYSFAVNATGLGYDIDTTFGDGGYETVAKGTFKPLTSIKDAGTYVTTVRLIDSSGTTHDYSIEWTIEQAKYDLTNVRWLDDGEIKYNGKVYVTLVESTIPKGLTPKYGGLREADEVGKSGTARVEFEIEDDVNFVKPDKDDPDSYIFNGEGGFEWSKEWVVGAVEITVKWTIGTITAEGGKKINGEVLAGGFDEYIEYVYYETNSSGEKLPDAEALTKPEITENKTRYYIAEVRIKDGYKDSYKFVTEDGSTPTEEDLLSDPFEAGRNLTEVQLEAKKTEYVYWGSPVAFQFNIKTGAISDKAFDIVYYSGVVALRTAPTNPGSYRAQLSLKSNYTKDYYIEGKYSFDFTIIPGTIALNWNENVKPYALKLNENQAKFVSYEYIDSAGNTVSLSSLRTPGTYYVSASITDPSKYTFTGGSTVTEWKEFTVVSGDSITDPSTSLTPSTDPNAPNSSADDGTVRFYLASIAGAAGSAPQVLNSAGLTKDVDYVIAYFKDGEPVVDFSAAGAYEIRVTLIGSAASQYQLESGSDKLTYTIVVGNGDGTTTTPNGEGDDSSDKSIISYLPIILSGVSLVLIVVFLIMTLNNLSAAKEAREKTKKLATMSYSFAPAGLLAMVLGLAESNWWIIAGVLMGLALIMAIVAFMTKGKKKRALALLEEERERIEEEKEMARLDREEQVRAEMREEQARRDNEMKMMFAAMQQGGGGYAQPAYDDAHIQNLIASTVSALLPAMQQQMALPPAQDSSAYAAPQPDYAARAENEALRAQLAEQQELLNQILQNQQQVQQQAYEEEPVDDISWLGNSEEVVSLEESYGALSDEGKRAYYEIGSYIMSKPRTSQNDGRYAVLFKYRGRTIFKLAIKEDAPVLYYPENGRAEVRVSDASTLELAKSAIDQTVSKVDSQM